MGTRRGAHVSKIVASGLERLYERRKGRRWRGTLPGYLGSTGRLCSTAGPHWSSGSALGGGACGCRLFIAARGSWNDRWVRRLSSAARTSSGLGVEAAAEPAALDENGLLQLPDQRRCGPLLVLFLLAYVP